MNTQAVKDIVKAAGPATTSALVKTAKGSKKSKSAKKANGNSKGPVASKKRPWMFSGVLSSKFIPAPPLFSDDDRYVLVASRRTVHVYSTSTSLEEWSLKHSTTGDLVAFCKTSHIDNTLFTLNSSGTVSLWNWTTQELKSVWNSEARSYAISTSKTPKGKMFVYISTKGEPSEDGEPTGQIIAREVDYKKMAFTNEGRPILNCPFIVREFRVIAGGFAIGFGDSKLVIGKASKNDPYVFTWHSIPVNSGVTCFDVKTSGKAGADIDLAYGTPSGEIYVYTNIVSRLDKIVAQASLEGFNPQKLHWHRNAVGSLQWSRDGNYIISGGRETVLVLWQLRTNSMSTLPHLSSEIVNVVVSPFGGTYAVKLSDNSIIVLSAAELKATAYISGIQARAVPRNLLRRSRLDAWAQGIHPKTGLRTPLAVDPVNNSRIHLAVPLSQVSHGTVLPSSPFLQTFDYSTGQHVARQALTRNHITSPNVGPDRTQLYEPDVVQLDVSSDGQWMAVVEEWMPPANDLDFLSERSGHDAVERNSRKELYLKIWKWESEKSCWALNTRIDNPHGTSCGLVNSVLDLRFHPSKGAFATVGDDCAVRIWAPKMKTRHNIPMRGMDNSIEISWSCFSVSELEKNAPFMDINSVSNEAVIAPQSGQLAFSTDGSVLAASVDVPILGSEKTVHFIDTSNGRIARSEQEIYQADLVSLAFAGRHLIVLSSVLTVWDVVTNERVYTIGINEGDISPKVRVEMSRLEVNSTGTEFAVSLPLHTKLKVFGEVSVFSVQSAKPLFTHQYTSSIVTALKRIPGTSGFVCLDSNGEVRVLETPVGGSSRLDRRLAGGSDPKKAAEAGPKQQQSQMDVYADAQRKIRDQKKKEEEEADRMEVDSESDEDGAAEMLLVRPSQLAELFEGVPSHALPPVKSIFSRVAGLMVSKP